MSSGSFCRRAVLAARSVVLRPSRPGKTFIRASRRGFLPDAHLQPAVSHPRTLVRALFSALLVASALGLIAPASTLAVTSIPPAPVTRHMVFTGVVADFTYGLFEANPDGSDPELVPGGCSRLVRIQSAFLPSRPMEEISPIALSRSTTRVIGRTGGRAWLRAARKGGVRRRWRGRTRSRARAGTRGVYRVACAAFTRTRIHVRAASGSTSMTCVTPQVAILVRCSLTRQMAAIRCSRTRCFPRTARRSTLL